MLFNSILYKIASNFYSITRDNASNNNTFLTYFEAQYQKALRSSFDNDIRCASHILNIVVQDILLDYTANSTTDEFISQYTVHLTQQQEEHDSDKGMLFYFYIYYTNYLTRHYFKVAANSSPHKIYS